MTKTNFSYHLQNRKVSWTKFAGMLAVMFLLFASQQTNAQCPGVLTLTPTQITCAGAANGAITASLAGVGPYTYLWNTGATTATITGLNGLASPGLAYTVTVTDQGNSNCTKSGSVNIIDPDVIDAEFDYGSGTCFGDPSIIDLTPDGGTPSYTYAWSNAYTTEPAYSSSAQDPAGLVAGNHYQVLITDNNGCTYLSPVLTAPGAPTQISYGTPVIVNTCIGSADGSISLTTSGGNGGPYTYSWTDSTFLEIGTNEDLFGLPYGTYYLEIRDQFGCSFVDSFFVGGWAVPNGTLTATSPVCYGATSSLTFTSSAGTGPFDLTINGILYPGKTSGVAFPGPAINANTTFNLTIITDIHCTRLGSPISSATVNLETTPPVFNACPVSSINLGCNPPSIPVAADAVTAAGSVTDNCTVSSVVATSTGATGSCNKTQVWTVTATDNSGNTSVCSVTYVWKEDLVAPVITTGTIASCYATSALAEAAALAATTAVDGCPGTVTYAASTVGTCSAVVTVTATDVCGNQSSTTYNTRIDNTAPVISTTATSGNFGCNPSIVAPVFTGLDNCDGVFTPNVTTVGPTNTGCAYSQTWNANYTDACNNAATQVSITYTWTVDITPPTISCPSATTVAANNTGCTYNGSIGTATATDNCDANPVITRSPSGDLPFGTTVVTWTATDGCGNTAQCTQSVTVTNSGLSVGLGTNGITNIACRGLNTGAIDITASAGTPGYTYLWNNGNTNQDVSNLFAGNYTVTVKDANLCSVTGNFTVTQPATVLVISLSKTNVRCGGKSTGKIDALPTGGGGGYTYLWSNLATTSSISSLPAGVVYTVTVTDANGCSKTKSTILTAPPTLMVVGVNIGTPTGGATANASGGTPPYSFSWNTTPIQTTNPATGLTPGATYKVKVTDSKGCTAVSSAFTVPLPKLGVNTKAVLNAFVYPNPTEGIVNLNIDNTTGRNCNITLYDALGQLVYSNTLSSTDKTAIFDFSKQPKGLYSMSIEAGGQRKVIHLLLQ